MLLRESSELPPKIKRQADVKRRHLPIIDAVVSDVERRVLIQNPGKLYYLHPEHGGFWTEKEANSIRYSATHSRVFRVSQEKVGIDQYELRIGYDPGHWERLDRKREKLYRARISTSSKT